MFENKEFCVRFDDESENMIQQIFEQSIRHKVKCLILALIKYKKGVHMIFKMRFPNPMDFGKLLIRCFEILDTH